MSDGNFNRSLLQHSPLSSGLKMGKSQMRVKAVNALKLVLSKHFPSLDDATQTSVVSDFEELLQQ